MRRSMLAAVLPVLPVSALFAGDPAGPTISQFLKIRVPGAVQLAPDGTIYSRDFPDGIFQLYRRSSADHVASQGVRMTEFADGLASYSLSPDGKWIALEAATGGNENNQVFLLETATGTVTPILQNPKVQHSVNTWLRDSSGFVYTANDASPRDFYMYHYTIATKASKNLLSRSGQWSCADVSGDGSRMLVAEYRSISDSSIYIMEAQNGNLLDITAKPAEGTASNRPVGFTADEQSVFFASDFENGIVQLYSRSSRDAAAAPKAFLPGLKQFDLDGATLNQSRTLLATTHNENGYGNMRVYYLEPVPAPYPMFATPRGVINVNQIQGDTLVYSVSNAITPGITYAFDVPAQSEKMARNEVAITTRLDREPIDLSKFRLPEAVKFSSFDGVEIPAFLYLPADATKGRPVPFVVNFHGGPEGQFRPSFDRTVQYLVSQGYGVLQPNVRGSTGYGREFHMADNYKKRWDSVKDGAEAARWLVKEGWAEKGRIAAYGGSYGGFMAVATVIEGPDVFGASVDVVGIVNMKTFLEQTSGYRQKLREVEYGPLTDPDFLIGVSPIRRIDLIKVPMMIAHGLNDPRVPVGEAMQLAVALQKRGDDPELLFFPDEGHGFQKLENRILFSERMVKFLDRHIGAGRTDH